MARVRIILTGSVISVVMKRCEYNNKDEDSSLHNLNDKKTLFLIYLSNLDLARELNKPWSIKVMVIQTEIESLSTVTISRIDKGTGGLGNKRTGGDHPNGSIIKFCQNTKKSPGDLRRLTVIQTPVKNHQLMLGVENLQMSKIIMIDR